MSLNVGEFQDEEYEIPEEVTFMEKILGEEQPESPQKDAEQVYSTEETPKQRSKQQVEPQRPSDSILRLTQTDPQSSRLGTPRYYALKILNKKEISSQQ